MKKTIIFALQSSVFLFEMRLKKKSQKRLLQKTNTHLSIVSILFAFLTLNEFGVLLYSKSSLNFNEDFYEAF